MKTTVSEIQEQLAKEYGYKNWHDLKNDSGVPDGDIKIIAERYAKSLLEEAAENPIKETNDLLEQIDYWSSKYEFNFQFWGDANNNVFVEKGGVELYDSGGHEKPNDAIKAALAYIHKINLFSLIPKEQTLKNK